MSTTFHEISFLDYYLNCGYDIINKREKGRKDGTEREKNSVSFWKVREIGTAYYCDSYDFVGGVQPVECEWICACFFAALVIGVLFAKDEKAYGEALVYELNKHIFGVIVMAVILAAISGKLISASGVVQTIATYMVGAGFTGKLFVVVSFLITCLLAFATGTSVGTYFVVIPILFPVGVMAGATPEFMIGAIVSGAAFGDNLGPISDTTIASSATQHADLGMVVKTRMRYSLPAAIGATVLFLLFSKTADKGTQIEMNADVTNPVSLVMLVVPTVIIILCLMRKHLITALSWGILVGIVTSLLFGIYTIDGLISFSGGFRVSGAIIEAITGTAGTVAMLIAVFALLGVVECSGLFEDVGVFVSFCKE